MIWLLALGLAGPLQSESDTLTRARIMAEAGRTDEAIGLLESRLRSQESPPELALLAQLQAATGAIPQAAATLDRLLAFAPREHRLRTTRGAMLFELKRFDEARKELERVVREAPEADSGLAHYYLATVLNATGEPTAALALAERAVSLLPATRVFSLDSKPAPGVAARHLLAEIRFQQEAWDASLEALLREVIELAPEQAPARYLLSRIFLKTGRVEEARVQLERFERIKRAEEQITIALHLASIEGRRDEAIQQLERAVEADPEHTRALVLLARELTRAGRAEEAAPYLSRAQEIRPEVSLWLQELSP